MSLLDRRHHSRSGAAGEEENGVSCKSDSGEGGAREAAGGALDRHVRWIVTTINRGGWNRDRIGEDLKSRSETGRDNDGQTGALA
mgnify:CR=1 FL=1